MGKTPEGPRPRPKEGESHIPGFKMSAQTENLPNGALKAVVFTQEKQRAHGGMRKEKIGFELDPHGKVLIKDIITKTRSHKKHDKEITGIEISIPLSALAELPNMLQALKGRRIKASITLDDVAKFTLGDPWNDDSLSLTILDPHTEGQDTRTLDLGSLKTLTMIVKNLTNP